MTDQPVFIADKLNTVVFQTERAQISFAVERRRGACFDKEHGARFKFLRLAVNRHKQRKVARNIDHKTGVVGSNPIVGVVAAMEGRFAAVCHC